MKLSCDRTVVRRSTLPLPRLLGDKPDFPSNTLLAFGQLEVLGIRHAPPLGVGVLVVVAVVYLLAAGARYMVLALWSWMGSLGLGLKKWAIETVQAILRILKS